MRKLAIAFGDDPTKRLYLSGREALRGYRRDGVSISVIIPLYNGEKYIDETLSSIESQCFEKLEIICVDDCSIDGSLEVVRQHQLNDNRITIVEHATNMGAGAAINTGFALAGGKFVQVLGEDDALTQNALSTLYDLCEQAALDVCLYSVEVVCDSDVFDELSDRVAQMEKYHEVRSEYQITSGVDLLMTMVENGEYRMTNGPMIVRSDHLSGLKSNIEGIKHEDMAFTYKLLVNAERATLIPDKLYRYRIRRSSQESNKHIAPDRATEIESLLISAYEMLAATPPHLMESDSFQTVIEKLVFSHVKRCADSYIKLDDKDRKQLQHCSDWRVKTYLPLLEKHNAAKVKAEKASRARKKAESELKRLKSSKSYRLGKCITYLPRRILKMINAR